MKAGPKISVCIAVRNGSATIGRAIASVLSQDYSKYEILVADGGSTDGTLEVVSAFGARVKCVSEADTGIADAWNKAVRNSSGEWVYFMGADDTLASNDVLSRVAAQLEKVVGLVVYGGVIYVDASGREIGRLDPEWRWAEFRHYGMTFSHQGVFQAIRLFREYGLFSEQFSIAADYEMLLRYLKDHDAVHLPETWVARVEVGGISTQEGRALSVLREFAEAGRLHDVSRWSMRFARAYSGAMLKHVLIGVFGKELGGRVIDYMRVAVGRHRHR